MRATFSIFPKFYRHLDVRGLADLVRQVGLDTTNLVVRDGYWVTGNDLAREVPAFVKAMAAAGLKIAFATAGYSARQIAADPTPLSIFADNGITEFRMGYFRVEDDDPAASLDAARRQMEQTAAVCEASGIRAVYQVHHGTLIPNATGAHYLVRGLPAAHVGVMLDPGNQVFEGSERWDRSARLLGEHLVAVGVKDAAPRRDPARAAEPDKGWSCDWATLDEGVTNWLELLRALKAVEFEGTFVWMPFYDADNPQAMTEKLTREVAYLRKLLADVQAGEG